MLWKIMPIKILSTVSVFYSFNLNFFYTNLKFFFIMLKLFSTPIYQRTTSKLQTKHMPLEIR